MSKRDLTFAAGDTVRAYTELTVPTSPAAGLHYLATYRLLRTVDVAADYVRAEWPEAVVLGFGRRLRYLALCATLAAPCKERPSPQSNFRRT
jgi:hypothetical protein